jgi:uncharacterized membrane protein YjgN (DUF898 family)
MTDAAFPAETAGFGAEHDTVRSLSAEERYLRYTGRGGELFWIYVKNILFSVLTLGVYRFWGNTRIRRYLWSHLLFLGEPFEYTGTGWELFLGFLKAMLVLVPLFLGFGILEVVLLQVAPGFVLIVPILQAITVLGLTYLGLYAARRYRMSRTLWRGIRFQQRGSAWTYLGLALRGLLLTVLTLGLYLPFLDARLRRYEMNNLSFGTEPFAFDGEGRDLFKPFLVAWLLAIPTFLMSMFWFAARSRRYYASRTSFGGLRFAMPVTGWQVARLHIGNALLTFISFGLLYPLVVRRMASFWCNNLAVKGRIDFSAIAQAERGPETGEGLASYLGLETMGV